MEHRCCGDLEFVCAQRVTADRPGDELRIVRGVIAGDRSCAGIVIAGAPGVGKTRLAREALDQARPPVAYLLDGRNDRTARSPADPLLEVGSIRPHASAPRLAKRTPKR